MCRKPLLEFVGRAAPYAVCLDQPRGETVMLHVGRLSYGLSRTFFDSQRLIARMAEMNVEQTILSPATPFVNFDVSASLERESAELYNDGPRLFRTDTE
jgi:hypothetical protein